MAGNININSVALGTACVAAGCVAGPWGIAVAGAGALVCMPAVRDRCLAPIRQLFNWRPLSTIPTCAVILSSGAGSYLASYIDDGMVAIISGAAIGALSAGVYLYRNGWIHPMDSLPPQALTPFNVVPDSLLHLDSPFDIRVYYGDQQHINTLDMVFCSSVSIAIICSMLKPEYQRQHKTFFETEGRTVSQCLEFILSRPAFEIDPEFDFGVLTQYFNSIKFDVIEADPGQERARRMPNQRQSREALSVTGRRPIRYPATDYLTDDILRHAADRAVDLVIRSPELNRQIDQIYQHFMLAAPFGGALPRIAREAGAMAGARTGARAGVDAVRDALLQADQAPAGVLVEGAFFGALAGAQAGIRQAIVVAAGNQNAAAAAGTGPGGEEGNSVVLRIPQKRPIIAHRRFPVDRGALLTRIRDEVRIQDDLDAQQGGGDPFGRIPVVPRDPPIPRH